MRFSVWWKLWTKLLRLSFSVQSLCPPVPHFLSLRPLNFMLLLYLAQPPVFLLGHVLHVHGQCAADQVLCTVTAALAVPGMIDTFDSNVLEQICGLCR